MATAEPVPELTRGGLLARNTGWNFIGQVIPLAVAVPIIPALIRAIGIDRFGVLTLAWMLIGYFSLFDLGMGRGLTKIVSDKLGTGHEDEIPALVWTALIAMLVVSFLGTVVLLLLSPWLASSVLKIPAMLHLESVRSFYLLAWSLPAVIVTSGLRGVLEAQQRFGVLNAIRVPMGVFNFLGPLLVTMISRSLVPLVLVLVIARFIGLVAHLLAVLAAMPALRRWSIRLRAVGPVLSFGGWVTVSSVASPLMMYMDRLVIGATIGMSAVAFYATPWEVVTKLFVVPTALVTVLFPAFAVSFAQDPARAAFLMRRGVKYILLFVFPLVLVIVTFAYDGLRLWLGADFAAHAAPVARWLAVGVLINCLSIVAITLVHGAGRPDLPAKLHLIELPVYLALLWSMVRMRGIEGAAIAWTARVALDAICLFVVVRICLPSRDHFLRRLSGAVLACCGLLIMATLPPDPITKVAFLGVALLGFIGWTWFRALGPEERALIHVPLKRVA